jgi:hypothetical protein
MTDTTGRVHPDDDIPSFEPWVLTLLSVFIPIGLGFMLPNLMWVFFALSGVIFAISMVMFARHERTSRREVPVRETIPPSPPPAPPRPAA